MNVSPPVNIPHNTIVVDPSDPTIVYVGTDLGIRKSTSGGNAWTHMGPEIGMPNVAVFDLQINAATNRLVAFTHGRGAFALSTTNDPIIAVTPDSLDFGNVTLGNSADKTFNVQNIGGGTLSGSASALDPFGVVSGGSFSLSGGQTQNVTVRFSPTSAVQSFGNVLFTGGNDASKTVAGTGVPPPPDTWISSGPATTTNSTRANFSFTSDDPASAFQCSLDGGAFTPCTNPKGFTKLRAGNHTFQVRATNSAGADPTPAIFNWAIDTTAPNTTINFGPPTLTNNPLATFEFSSSEAGGGFLCSLDGGAFVPCSSSFVSSALADGKHNFQVKAVDAAGNVDKLAAKAKAWTVDTPPPDTSSPRCRRTRPLAPARRLSLPPRRKRARSRATWTMPDSLLARVLRLSPDHFQKGFIISRYGQSTRPGMSIRLRRFSTGRSNNGWASKRFRGRRPTVKSSKNLTGCRAPW